MSHHDTPEDQGGPIDPQHTQPIPPVPPARPEDPAGSYPFGQPGAAPQQPAPQQGPVYSSPAQPGYGYGAPAAGHQQHGQPNQHGQQGHPGQGGAPGQYSGAFGHPAPGHTTAAPALAQQHPSRASRRAPWIAVPLAAILAAALATGGTYAVTRDNAVGASASGGSTTILQANPADFGNAGTVNWAATAAKVSPSVVSITNVTSNGNGDEGSGVVLDTAGNIVTNNHVVATKGTLTATLNDGRTYQASVVGTDPSTDLAVIRLKNPPSGLQPVTMGDDSKLVVGQPVMAVGNPLGLSGTVTTGIISALHRPVSTQLQSTTPDPSGQGGQGGLPWDNQNNQGGQGSQSQSQGTDTQVVTDAIQTSAAINPGNSGGALVSGSGKLIGINSSIASLSQSSDSSQSGNIGIGFAIPVTVVKNITSQLIKTGKAQHALLGVSVASQPAQVKDGSATRTGATVAAVSDGGAASKAGVKKGDVVISIDGTNVDSSDSLIAQVRERAVGQKVVLTVVRDGQHRDITVTLGAQPAS